MTSDNRSEPVDRATVDAKAGGTAAGGTAGALIGGAVAGPAGAGVGAVIGSVLGGAAGAAFDRREYREVEPDLRLDWERGPYHTETSSWDDASAAYQYGWDSAARPEFQGRSWDDARDDLERGWTGRGSWQDSEPLARRAWDRRFATGSSA